MNRFFHWIGKYLSDYSSSHKHRYHLKYTENDVWLECKCGQQADVPPEWLEKAYQKLRYNDTSWD